VADPEQPRDLTISRPTSARGPERADKRPDQPGAGTQPIFFRGLNRQGVRLEWRQKAADAGRHNDLGRADAALTDLPSGLEVEILLRQGGGKMGAAERLLLETVANEITWAGPLPPTKRLPSLPRAGRSCKTGIRLRQSCDEPLTKTLARRQRTSNRPHAHLKAGASRDDIMDLCSED